MAAVLVGIQRYNIIYILFIVLVVSPLYAQERLHDNRQVASARDLNLRGEIINIAISPANPDIISFESVEGGNLHRLWWLDLRTNHLEQITPRSLESGNSFWEAFSDRDIDWSPVKINNKIWFLFVSSGYDGQENIYLGNTECNRYLRLTSGNHVDHHPRWAPDGKSFVYVSSRRGSGDIYLVTNVDELIKKFEREVNNQNDDSREIVIDGVSSVEHHLRLTKNPRMDSFPDWSPDGRFLVYQGLIRTDGILHMDLFLMDIQNKTSEPINITQNPQHDAIQPKWSYDQSNIAYYVSPAGSRGEAPSTVRLSFVELSQDSVTGKINSFVTKGTIDANIRRNNNTGPLWGPGSRSLLYVKGEGSYTPILMYNLENVGSTKEGEVIREDRFDIIHREIAGFISENGAQVAYLTYEDQDYRIYKARPDGGILSRNLNDFYVKPVNPMARFEHRPAAFAVGGHPFSLFNQSGPSKTRFDFLKSFFVQYTVIPYSGSERPYEFALRFNYSTMRPNYLGYGETHISFWYSVVDLGGILTVPVDEFISKTAVFTFAGLGMVISHDYIAKPTFSRRFNVPFGFGIQYSVTREIGVIGQVTFRNISYLSEAENSYFNVQSRNFSIGVMYNL